MLKTPINRGSFQNGTSLFYQYLGEKMINQKFEIFKQDKLGQVRSYIDEDNNLWFIGIDIAKCLGYELERKALSDHVDKDDKFIVKYKEYKDSPEIRNSIWVPGTNDYSDKTIINEAGMYSLLFSSKRPEAKEFKAWICKEVIPSIRKHGGYILGQEELTKEQQADLCKKISALSLEVEKTIIKNKELHKKYTNTRRINGELRTENIERRHTNVLLKRKYKKINEEADYYFKRFIEKDTALDIALKKIDKIEHPDKYEKISHIANKHIEKYNAEITGLIHKIGSDGLLLTDEDIDYDNR